MAKQNIYDNERFFENFKNIRTNEVNFNDFIETPILQAMLPELRGKKILDIGCGVGQHAKQYSDMHISNELYRNDRIALSCYCKCLICGGIKNARNRRS